ncbi:MAG TPA: hypothetical protein VK400_07460 [Pyrinomonadaceae bacterium]|nr:hypothetical protein [Pyrinomonadaceae bacterium]
MAVINLLVEGEIDEVVAHKIICELGHQVGACYGKQGHGYIKNKLRAFNKSANNICYLALVDFMDTGYNCPPEVISNWLPHKNALMIFRVVVREIESWLLADRKNIAKFLNVGVEKIPVHPESENDPKQKLVNIAGNSRSSKIRNSLVPEQNSTAQVGKLYSSEIKRFVFDFWDVKSARLNSPSLDKCLLRLEEI